MGPSSSGNGFVHFSSLTVRGGRHTLSLRIDSPNLIDEVYETNNNYAEQYCWSPQALLAIDGYEVERPVPPDPYAGSEDWSGSEPFWPNCDGFRFGGPYADTHWGWAAVAVMPLGTTDVDVACHPMLRGVKNGFTTQLAHSGFGPGQLDFIMVDYHSAPHTLFDAGVIRVSGSDGYRIENDISLGGSMAPLEPMIYAVDAIPSGHVMRLYEWFLYPGLWALRLEDVAGGVDWGLAIFAQGTLYQGEGLGMRVNDRGPGGDECLTLDVNFPRYYCIAIYKTTPADLPKEGHCLLHMVYGVTGVGEDSPAPVATNLVGAWPNPFNPRTTIAFVLAAATEVRLTVIDLQGRRVRTLVAASLPAGRHEIVWDGRDEAGQPAPSGVYIARLAAGDVRQMRKLLLLK
jgi:hypothetical protein